MDLAFAPLSYYKEGLKVAGKADQVTPAHGRSPAKRLSVRSKGIAIG
jgi:hypothetical protein